ncbi:hypothetical protein [Nannocystis pusilla]|uniref:hypothetical protein n=1 Tax=Nannocystis pusilla TaxID=889268 RepID=UPI003B7ECB30
MASIRSDVISLDASQVPKHPDKQHLTSGMGYSPELLREAALRRLAADPRLDSEAREHARQSLTAKPAVSVEESLAPSHGNPMRALFSLLMSLFSIDEMRRWIASRFEREVLSSLPDRAPPESFALEFIHTLQRHGLIDEQFFALLRADRPSRKPEIDHVAQLFTATSAGTRPQLEATARWKPTPDELMDALIDCRASRSPRSFASPTTKASARPSLAAAPLTPRWSTAHACQCASSCRRARRPCSASPTHSSLSATTGPSSRSLKTYRSLVKPLGRHRTVPRGAEFGRLLSGDT